MGDFLFDELALMMIMMWPIFPLFLIELNFVVDFWRRIGVWTYAVVFLEWLPIAIVIYSLRYILLSFQITLGIPFFVLGILSIVAGLVLHSWTAKLLGIKATIGYTEMKTETQRNNNQEIITSGPFSVVRHPSYWAHTSILVGFFLITGVVAIGLIAIIDLAITYFITTELEDKELVERFGNKYIQYQKQVPKFFPKIFRK